MIRKRTNAQGKVRYGVRVDRDGRQVWVGTFDRRSDAKAAEAKARISAPATKMTCDGWADFWLEGYRERQKDSSYDTASSALSKFKRDFKGVPLARITDHEAETWARANTWRVPVVVTLLNAAVKKRHIAFNPFEGLSEKGPGRKHLAPLSVADVAKLAEVAGRQRKTLRSFVLFAAYSGMRIGELFALEWGDIDFEERRIRVERRLYKGRIDLPKNGKRRKILLIPEARDALLPLDRSTDYVFQNTQGGRMSQPSLAYWWKTIADGFGRHVTPHELKHFTGHHLYATLGIHERLVAHQLGHSDGGKLVRELYGHGDYGALEALDAAMDNVVQLRPIASQGQ